MLSPAIGLQKTREKLQKDWKYWEGHSPHFLNALSIEGPAATKKIKCRPPVQRTEGFCYTLSA